MGGGALLQVACWASVLCLSQAAEGVHLSFGGDMKLLLSLRSVSSAACYAVAVVWQRWAAGPLRLL